MHQLTKRNSLKPLLILVIIALIILGAFYFFKVKNKPNNNAATQTPSTAKQGTLKGKLGFRADSNPAQIVCAQPVNEITKRSCIETTAGQNDFEIPLDPGSYYVYAALKEKQGDFTPDYHAYYTEFVKCATKPDCDPIGHHQYIAVEVKSGETTQGAEPSDWYDTAQLPN